MLFATISRGLGLGPIHFGRMASVMSLILSQTASFFVDTFTTQRVDFVNVLLPWMSSVGMALNRQNIHRIRQSSLASTLSAISFMIFPSHRRRGNITDMFRLPRSCHLTAHAWFRLSSAAGGESYAGGSCLPQWCGKTARPVGYVKAGVVVNVTDGWPITPADFLLSTVPSQLFAEIFFRRERISSAAYLLSASTRIESPSARSDNNYRARKRVGHRRESLDVAKPIGPIPTTPPNARHTGNTKTQGCKPIREPRGDNQVSGSPPAAKAFTNGG